MNWKKSGLIGIWLHLGGLCASGAGAPSVLAEIIDLDRPELRHLKADSGDAAALWGGLLGHYRQRLLPGFPFVPADRDRWAVSFRRLHPSPAAELGRSARRLMRNKGIAANPAGPGEPVPYGLLLPGGPTAVPPPAGWGSDWLLLGRAYWLTGDESFAVAALDRIAAWAGANRPPSPTDSAPGSPTWDTAAVAVRLLNLMRVFNLCLGSAALEGLSGAGVLQQIGLHAACLRERAEAAPGRSLPGSAALLAAGALFPEFREAGDWERTGRAGIERGITVEVLPDGVHHSGSIGEHALVLWGLIRAQRTAAALGRGLSERSTGRLVEMLDFLKYAARPDGYAPSFDGSPPIDVRPLLQAGALQFNLDYLKPAEPRKLHPDLCWEFGPEADGPYRALKPRAPDNASRGFPYGGYLTLRSGWEGDGRFLLFRSGREPEPGPNPLDFRLSAFERNFIIGGEETTPPSAVAEPAGPKSTGPRLHHYRPHGESGFISASEAVEIAPGDTLLSRRKIFSPAYDYWLVADRLSRPGEHTFSRRFYLPDLSLQVDRRTQEILVGDGPGGCLLIKNLAPDGWELATDRTAAAAGYRVTWTKRADGDAGLYLLLYPYRTRGGVIRPPVTTELIEIKTADGVAGRDSSLAVRIGRPGFTDLIMIWSGRKGVEKDFGAGKMAWDFYWERLNPLDRRMIKERWENPM